jgi:hypothetical protein
MANVWRAYLPLTPAFRRTSLAPDHTGPATIPLDGTAGEETRTRRGEAVLVCGRPVAQPLANTVWRQRVLAALHPSTGGAQPDRQR